ncbi:TVA4 protein, partial [Heliornis fulica]|nr:TVA4 protein [Heliornis fulica]
ETTDGSGINITCSHPNIVADYIHCYCQLPGQGPSLLMSSAKASKDLGDPPGQLWVASDRWSSALRLYAPRRGDAAVYYCAVG